MNRYFPIKTQTACRLKWAWSTLYLNSNETASCHRSSIGLIPDDFDSFHNTPTKIQARQKMLDSRWPGGGCEYCQDIEKSGGISDRMFQNQIPDVYPNELDIDQTQTNVTPSILEVFFSNTCNFKCVYCKGSLSSAIQMEDANHGGPITPQEFVEKFNRYKELVPKFWKWFEQNNQNIQRLQVLGGEPFLQKDFIKLLDFFDLTPCPNLEFNIISNLGIPNSILSKYIKRIHGLVEKNKIKRFDILVSIDAWGPAQEYVRNGLDLELLELNLQTLMQSQSFRIGLLSTVCSLTIKEMPFLAEKFLEWNQFHRIFWYMHLVTPSGTSIFDPNIFDYGIFENDLKKTFDMILDDNWDDCGTKDILSGIINKIKNYSSNDVTRQKKLINYLDEIDRRRNLDWRKVFPWLEAEVNNVV